MRDHARAHFGDSIFYGDMYIVQSGNSSQRTAADPALPAAPRPLFADSEENYGQFYEQMAAMRKELQTHSTHIRDELSLILQQTGSQQSLLLDQTPPQLMDKEQVEECKEHAQESGGRGHAYRHLSKQAAFRMRFQLPTLFTSRVWEIARIDAHQGWDLCFRTYNRRPSNAEIFRHCHRANLTEVQRLIQNGEASLLDVNEDGYNLLWVASWSLSSRSSSFDLIEWLFHQGLRLYGAELTQWLIYTKIIAIPGLKERLMRILIGDLEEFDADMDKQGFAELWRLGHNSTYFEILLRRFNGFVRSMPTSERFQFVAATISALDSPVLTLRKLELCRGNTSPHDTILKQFYVLHGSEVLHHVAQALSYHQTSAHLDLWTDIGVTAIQNGADPVTVVDRQSPLLGNPSVFMCLPIRQKTQYDFGQYNTTPGINATPSTFDTKRAFRSNFYIIFQVASQVEAWYPLPFVGIQVKKKLRRDTGQQRVLEDLSYSVR
ncbi:hypothetical protein MBLNU13_g07570t1 [Cladosporium sp. NU13]